MGVYDWFKNFFRGERPSPEPDFIPKERMADASSEEISQKIHKLSSTLGAIHYKTADLMKRCKKEESENKRRVIEASLKHETAKFLSKQTYEGMQEKYKNSRNSLKRANSFIEKALAHNVRSLANIDNYVQNKNISNLDNSFRYLGHFALACNRAKIQIMNASTFITKAKSQMEKACKDLTNVEKVNHIQYTIDTITEFQILLGSIELLIKTTYNLQSTIKIHKEVSPQERLKNFA